MRKYKRKRPPQWRDKDKRMTLALQMRAEGKSLRQIAGELAVDEKTVRNDLARWQEIQTQSNVAPLLRKSAAESRPAGGNFPHQDSAPEASVIALRRQA